MILQYICKEFNNIYETFVVKSVTIHKINHLSGIIRINKKFITWKIMIIFIVKLLKETRFGKGIKPNKDISPLIYTLIAQFPIFIKLSRTIFYYL